MQRPKKILKDNSDKQKVKRDNQTDLFLYALSSGRAICLHFACAIAMTLISLSPSTVKA